MILIKIGKVFSTVRRDGLFRGGKRVLNYLGIFLKTMLGAGKGDVLIITQGVGDSAHYRAYSQAEELNIHGIKTSVMVQDNPFLSRYAKKFKIFILHRTLYTPTIARLIKNIKNLKREIIFETDDLVFDIDRVRQTGYYQEKMNALEKKQYEKGVGEEILKDSYVKVATTATSYLAKILESYNKKVFISKNKLTNHELEVADEIIKKIRNTKYKIQDTIKIGYFSGTASHNKDFATITDALAEIMEKYENVGLLLVGPLDVENRLNKFKERIIHLPLAPRGEYYKNLSKADINLAPLVAGDPFCECKSELKFFEPGILGIPTVAVANQTFKEAITEGVDGFLAATKEEWIEKLERLIADENLRKSMGEKAREKALKDYTNKNSHNVEYYDYLRSRLDQNNENSK